MTTVTTMTSEPEIIAAEPDRTTRAATDALRLAVAAAVLLGLLLIGWLFDDAIVGFLADLYRGIDALPSWLLEGLVLLGQVLAVACLGYGLVLAVMRRAWLVLVSSAVAGAVAAGLLGLLEPLVDSSESVVEVDSSLFLFEPDHLVSAATVAVLAAVVTAAAPWMGRRWRQAAWLAVALVALLRVVGSPVAFDTALALSVGWVAGAATVLIAGAPSRRPSGASIAAGLAAVGVPLAKLEQASVDARGSTPYFATTTDGEALFVKALGDDERSGDLMFRLYRRIQPRDLADERAFSSLRRAVEHEALVSMVAGQAGTRTPKMVAFARADPAGFVLAYQAIPGRSLDRVEPAEFTDELLDAVWEQLQILRTHRIAHRDLRLANVFRDDDGVAWLIDFGFSELAASQTLLRTDLAELLASSATKVGVERAVSAGRRAVGDDVVASALDRLQPPLLSGATRTDLKASPELLPALRLAISAPA